MCLCYLDNFSQKAVTQKVVAKYYAPAIGEKYPAI